METALSEFKRLCKWKREAPELETLLEPLQRASLYYLTPEHPNPPEFFQEHGGFSGISLGEAMSRTMTEPIEFHPELSYACPVLTEAVGRMVEIREPLHRDLSTLVSDSAIHMAAFRVPRTTAESVGCIAKGHAWVVTGNTLRMYEYPTRKLIHRIPGFHADQLSSHGSLVLALDRVSHTIAILHPRSPVKRGTIWSKEATSCAAFKTQFAVGTPTGLRLHDTATGKTLLEQTIIGGVDFVRAECTSVLAGNDHSSFIWDIRSNKFQAELHGLCGRKTTGDLSGVWACVANEGITPGASAATWDFRWNLPLYKHTLPGYPLIRPAVDTLRIRPHCIMVTAGPDVFTYSLETGACASISETSFARVPAIAMGVAEQTIGILGVGSSPRLQRNIHNKIDEICLRHIGVNAEALERAAVAVGSSRKRSKLI
jgi:hypothetical protein